VTTIEYQLAESGKVKIEVFNLKGQKVEVLLNELKDAGKYSLNWDASGMNSGIYFLRFNSGTGNEVRKVILLK
jgi:5-hydroxyisourate hydrolase-like protein (transthyretin family)